MTQHTISSPYLIYLGDTQWAELAKTGLGLAYWRPERCVAQLREDGCKADVGLPDMSITEAVAAGAKTLVIGTAVIGGQLPKTWIGRLIEAMESGLDIASGLHEALAAIPELRDAAEATGQRIHDVRIPKGPFPIATGAPRRGNRLLAMGTDCAVGKKYAALAIHREMQARGMKASFRPTGQTGILITGDGVPLDAVVADFMAGAVEWLTPDNDADHWDHIEGQGSLFHVSYSGVTMALIHGGQPDALVLAHEPTRAHMRGLPGYDLPTLEALRDMALPIARIANPACEVVGVSVNTQHMGEDEARAYLADIEARMGLPATDPYRFGAGKLVDALEALG